MSCSYFCLQTIVPINSDVKYFHNNSEWNHVIYNIMTPLWINVVLKIFQQLKHVYSFEIDI